MEVIKEILTNVGTWAVILSFVIGKLLMEFNPLRLEGTKQGYYFAPVIGVLSGVLSGSVWVGVAVASVTLVLLYVLSYANGE